MSCSTSPQPSKVGIAEWNSMTERQREQYVRGLVRSGVIAVNKTTLRDLQQLFSEEARDGYVEQDGALVNFSKYPTVKQTDPPFQVGLLGEARYIFFDVDATGVVRQIRIEAEKNTAHEEIIAGDSKRP